MSPFTSGAAVASAITTAARSAARASPAGSVQRFVSQTDYDRFLCRVFATGDDRLVLKGGTRMLAAIPEARATRDVDLECREQSLDEARELLTARASVDLDDWYTFTFIGTKPAAGGGQPLVEAAEVTFEVDLGGRNRGNLRVDLAVHPRPAAPIVTAPPAFRLPIEGLATFDYAMIAVEDQIADKVCAMMSRYGPAGAGSSRAKDLVDLALLALHATPRSDRLRFAIRAEAARRGLVEFDTVSASEAIRASYGLLAKRVPLLASVPTCREAIDLVNGMLQPALAGSVGDAAWNPATLTWVPQP